MTRWLHFIRSSLFVVSLAAAPLAAETHVMGRGADPWAVPAWEAVFDEGPFDLPEGGTRESSVEEALALGWKALHALDDREAERAFRLAVTRDETNGEGYFGLALANDARPGRALAFAERAVAGGSRVSGAWVPVVGEFAALCRTRGPARRAAESRWARTVRDAWRAAPAGEARQTFTALLVRCLLRAGLRAEARLRLGELLAEVPDHPARAYALWFAADPEEAVAAVRSLPATPGARRAAGAMLERLGRPEDAAGWYVAAAALAAARHPSDMEDWRLVEDMRNAGVAALAAAGRADFPEEVPVSTRVEAWLRLEAWDRLAAQPDLSAKAPLRERLALAHARSLAGFVQGRLPEARAWLTEVGRLVEIARRGPAGTTRAELPEFEALELELELHDQLARGEADDARLRFAQLQHVPPARAARLALALDLPLEAMRAARQAVEGRPQARPERELLVRLAEATQQRLLPEDEAAAPLIWPPLPPPPPPPTAAAPGTLPAWTLPDATGTARHLAEIQDGRPVVVLFFLGHECRHCMEQLRAFDPMAPRFEKAGAGLVAVSVDGPDGVAQTFATPESDPARRPLAFPVVADAERSAFASWGVIDQFQGDAIHGVFVLDGAGRLRWRHLGVEPYMDVAAVLAAVEALEAAP